MALVATVGAANANSWATVAEFKTFRDVRLPANATVTAASDPLIEAALIVACRNINENFVWTGVAVDDVQALTWPRLGMLTRNGFPINSTTIPAELKNAQCEMAFQIIAGADLTADNAAAAQGVESVKAGSVAVSFQPVDTSDTNSVDMIMLRLTNEFAYLSAAVPGEVRRMLVSSWYEQPTIIKPIIFGAM